MKKIQASFHQTAKGNRPARDWLRTLDQEDKKRIGEDLMVAEMGWPIGMPVCRSVTNTPLHEIRTQLSGGRIARVLIAVAGDRLCILHGFIKKTQKTPKQDIELAMARLKETPCRGKHTAG